MISGIRSRTSLLYSVGISYPQNCARFRASPICWMKCLTDKTMLLEKFDVGSIPKRRYTSSRSTEPNVRDVLYIEYVAFKLYSAFFMLSGDGSRSRFLCELNSGSAGTRFHN